MYPLAVLFTGPTLPFCALEEISLQSEIISLKNVNEFNQRVISKDINAPTICVLPPVSEGDIYKLATHKPKIIGIVDGFFENMPSVWHKEILFSMSKGVHVYGASSMGALRASELYVYGMVGVGSIFEAYKDLLFEDDDEVTIVHGPKELGYPVLSEAMVNIRRTVDDAYNESIIDEHHREMFLKKLKGTFYKERGYHLLKGLHEADSNILKCFFEWLLDNRKDQKREDAHQLLLKIDHDLQKGLPVKSVHYNFEDTSIWRRVLSA